MNMTNEAPRILKIASSTHGRTFVPWWESGPTETNSIKTTTLQIIAIKFTSFM